MNRDLHRTGARAPRMRQAMRAGFVLGLLLCGNGPALAQTQSLGVWRNPQNSVHVRAQPCGERLCGVVVWANDKAKADSARGGTPRLIGLTLFRDFERIDDSHARGKVFVPDLNRTFSGAIEVIDSDHIRANGCLIGRIGCRAQIWTRVRE